MEESIKMTVSTHLNGNKIPNGNNHKERKEESHLDQVYFKGSLTTDFYSLDFCVLMEFPLIP